MPIKNLHERMKNEIKRSSITPCILDFSFYSENCSPTGFHFLFHGTNYTTLFKPPKIFTYQNHKLIYFSNIDSKLVEKNGWLTVIVEQCNCIQQCKY